MGEFSWKHVWKEVHVYVNLFIALVAPIIFLPLLIWVLIWVSGDITLSNGDSLLADFSIVPLAFAFGYFTYCGTIVTYALYRNRGAEEISEIKREIEKLVDLISMKEG